MIGDRLDRAMDFTVAPGYSVLGYRVRKRWWDPIADERLAGRRVLVTGASSGIGEALCARLYAAGAEVHMLVRNGRRGEDARRRIEAAGGDGGLEAWVCDLSDLDQVRDFTAAFGESHDSLDALVHNAGVLTEHRELSTQGRELTFATHVLGPFLLSELLRPQLQRGTEPTVVFVSSGGMYAARPQLGDLELARRDFDGTKAYAHAKRLQVVLAAELARREHAGGVLYCSVHPGWVDTPGLQRSLPRFQRLLRPFLRNPHQGADTAAWLLASPRARCYPGAFWHDRRPRTRHRVPWTDAGEGAGRRLYAELAQLGDLWDDRVVTSGEPA